MTDRFRSPDSLEKNTAVQAGVKYVAGMIADDLSDWPPSIALDDTPRSQRFVELVAPGAKRPSLAAFVEAVKQVRWELERDFEAIAHYERNHHLEQACPDPRDRLASELIRHYILESFLSLIERTENRVKRADVLVGLSRLETHVRARWGSLH